MAFVPTEEEAVPRDPAEGLAAVVALRRLADRLEAGQVERAAASRLGAEQVEPEHLLLALAGGCEDPAALALAEFGVDAGAIVQAIEDDLVAMLEVVGV